MIVGKELIYMWPFKKRIKLNKQKNKKNVMVVGKWKIHLSLLKQQIVRLYAKIVLNKFVN